jgi:hypothetical protein
MQDLSSLSKGWPSYGASMAAGSTVDNEIPQGKAPGTPSEQTDLPSQGIDAQSHVSPDLSYTPDQGDKATGTTSRFSTTYSPGAPAWKTVK